MNVEVKMVDPAALVLLPDIVAKAEDNLKAAMVKTEGVAREKRKTWEAERRAKLQSVNAMSEHEVTKILERALESQELCGNFQVELQVAGEREIQPVSVCEILADPEYYHKALTRDPLEPDYDGGRLVGILYLDGNTPCLISQARGQTNYKLLISAEEAGVPRVPVEYCVEHSDTFVDGCVSQMRATGNFFRSGNTIVHRRDDNMFSVNEARLEYELSRIVKPYRKVVTKREGETQKFFAFTRSLLNQILEVAPERLPVLNGFADHPLVTPGGSIISDPGYDVRTGLFILNGQNSFPEFYEKPTDKQLVEAVRTCLLPFRSYEYDDKYGRTATLIAVMIAVLRPALPCAPMTVTTANKTGVGKGYMQQALAIIRTGEMPELRHLEKESLAEFRKTLFTLLYERKSVIALDNMDGPLRNDTLSSFITAPVWSDRVLGKTESGGSLRNDTLLLLNGCRVDLGKNIARKVVRIGLREVGGKDHRFRDFGFLPHREALKHRKAIISAVLTIACHARHCEKAPGTVGSFEDMDQLVRQPLADIASRLPETGLHDPLDLFRETVSSDVDSPEEAELLEMIFNATNGEEFDSNDLRAAMSNGVLLEKAFREFASVSPTLSTHSIGAILNQLRGERFGDYILKSRKLGGKNMWRVEHLESSQQPHDTALAGYEKNAKN